jgi:L-lactate dehydrogenase complex protein LldG
VGAGRIIAEPSCGLEEGPWEELSPEVSPRTLADVDIAVLPGSIGVAENAAVAIEGKRAPVRALAFLCQQLVLILDLDAIVPDMHEAILRMPPDATRFHHFTWVSGPSKTADIEQVLVLGAHGPRALVVVGRRTR